MTKTVSLIGIGTGNPDHVTQEARAKIRVADRILIPRKGSTKSDLADLRRVICASLREDTDERIIYFDMPQRDSNSDDYLDGVTQWHDAIAQEWRRAMDSVPEEEQHFALLVWGDPALYDSTIRIAERLPGVEIEIVPGITAPQVLAAAHKIPFNMLGAPFVITTGRRLRNTGFPNEVDTAIIMLDGGCAFQFLPQEQFMIYWGAFLGMREQILVSGPLIERTAEIIATRSEARKAHGWIMDTYLLRRL